MERRWLFFRSNQLLLIFYYYQLDVFFKIVQFVIHISPFAIPVGYSRKYYKKEIKTESPVQQHFVLRHSSEQS